jgi:hypothetical protein
MTTISAAGILYIRQNGVNIEYSSSSTFSPATVISSWPVTVTNTAPTSYLKVYFTTDITFTGGADRFFICGSEYIQFGNTTLNTNGTRPAITIQDIIDYPGLIQNGTSESDGYSYIAIVNLNIVSNGNSGTWSSTNANTVLQGVGTTWGSIAPNTPYVLLNFGISPYSLDVIDSTTYALNQTFSQTVQAGQTTIPAQVAGFKTFQILSGGHSTITIDNTGKITTTSVTPPGTYTLSIYGVDDYTTTLFNLTVTGIPEPTPVTVPTSSVTPCCQGPICVQASPTTDKDNELLTTYTSGQAIVNNVDRYYTDIKTGARTFFVKPVFGSYREYMNYLQTKNRYI